MPDFITPEILISKLGEMEEAFEKPVGGRRKAKSDDEEKGLSRGNIKKVSAYIVDSSCICPSHIKLCFIYLQVKEYMVDLKVRLTLVFHPFFLFII
jgi:hypothetical protein